MDYVEFYSHGFLYKSTFYQYAHMSNISFAKNFFGRSNVLLLYYIYFAKNEAINTTQTYKVVVFMESVDEDGPLVKTMLERWKIVRMEEIRIEKFWN